MLGIFFVSYLVNYRISGKIEVFVGEDLNFWVIVGRFFFFC